MPDLPITSLAAVIDQFPLPVLLTTETGHVVAASPACRAFVGPVEVGAALDGLLRALEREPATIRHRVETDAEAHVLVAIEEAPPVPPTDVAALARATAHDFNNLLGVIINFASLAAADLPPGSGAAQDLQEVLVASRRAATLTQRLLQLATAAPEEQST